MDAFTVTGFAAIPVLVAANGFFVAAEFSLVTIRRTELDDLVREGRSGARSALHAVAHLDAAIAATQLGITLASLLLGWLGEESLAHVLGPLIASIFGGEHQVLTHSIASAIALAIITALHVVLGELAPKTIALERPRAVALWVARPLLVFERLFAPAISVLNGLGNVVVKLVGLKAVPTHSRAHSVAELAALVDETQQAGILRPEQAEVLQNVFRLSKSTAGEILVPIEKVGMLDLRWSPDRALDEIAEGAHTRMPVYDGDRTRIVGTVNTKDLFHLYRLRGIVNVLDVMRPVVYVAASTRLEELLRDFRKRRLHLALVKDGEKTLGIVTLEDILEEIVGDIEDEQDARRSS